MTDDASVQPRTGPQRPRSRAGRSPRGPTRARRPHIAGSTRGEARCVGGVMRWRERLRGWRVPRLPHAV